MTKLMSVQVKKCQLRNKPSFMAKVTASLEYGTRVSVVEEQESWLNISPGAGAGGWAHVSALSEKEIVLDPSSRGVAASTSSDEIALAGKGFNEQVENQFKKDNAGIDFSWIDRMEKIVVEPEQSLAFLKDGGIGQGGGA